MPPAAAPPPPAPAPAPAPPPPPPKLRRPPTHTTDSKIVIATVALGDDTMVATPAAFHVAPLTYYTYPPYKLVLRYMLQFRDE